MPSRARSVLVLALALVPAVASASNMTHPRTPVLWNEPPCMTLHDRSVDPVLHLPYAIPYEDTEVTADEVTQSRTHQFFAFCRPHHPQDFLPVWITDDDVASAVAKNLIDTDVVEPPDILAHAESWQGCWFRINDDADRRPITEAMAAAGVDWDTSDLDAGAYTIDGYTFEPVFNVWWLRPGVVKIHDGDPDAVGPAAAVSTGELTPYRNETVTVEGCVDALDGTTYTVAWAAVTQQAPEWVDYAADLEIDGDGFAFDFKPPEGLWGESGMLRMTFVDPQDREYVAYMSDNLLVINSDNPSSCDNGGSFIGGPCGSDSGGDGTGDSAGSTGTDASGGSAGSSGGAAATTGGSDDGNQSDDGGDPKGCGCRSGGGPIGGAALLVLLALVRRRRPASSRD